MGQNIDDESKQIPWTELIGQTIVAVDEILCSDDELRELVNRENGGGDDIGWTLKAILTLSDGRKLSVEATFFDSNVHLIPVE